MFSFLLIYLTTCCILVIQLEILAFALMLTSYLPIMFDFICKSCFFCIRDLRQPKGKVGNKKAIDCGAGIGRITKRLLLPLFSSVDMIDVNQTFLDEAKNSYLEQEASRVERFICCGLQSFVPEAGHYDVIWCQWVLGHLNDLHLVEFFKRCQKGLAPNGMIFIKENVNRKNEADFDENDSSWCRPKDALMALIKQAGLTVVREQRQVQFPKELYEVWMFALQ